MKESYIAESLTGLIAIIGLFYARRKMVSDTRNWKCFIDLHQYGEPIGSGRYKQSSDLGHLKEGNYYTCRCIHCGKIKTFYV
ncbi:hypothetical protein NGG03_16820 [Klebsiella michiganensis]|uniref:hypothetical protein n=1 Tax=Klebsiella michiganensis TaxID=1134687 RepID=UPI002DB9CAB6|nr:hypothetical protein [Klebsiella michiganensis]MEB8291574.1 hypothetical protein [Klebsiella michiganensis]